MKKVPGKRQPGSLDTDYTDGHGFVKTENREPKPESTPRTENRKLVHCSRRLAIRISEFGILSDLGFRNSDFCRVTRHGSSSYCPFTRKKPAVFVMGMSVLWPLVVAISLHAPAGNAPVRCTT
jgi:hypothetical protein